MIVLVLSGAEVESLLKGAADVALRRYLASELQQELLMPDDTLPARVVLEDVSLVDQRHYSAVIRTYATAEQADAAWLDEDVVPHFALTGSG